MSHRLFVYGTLMRGEVNEAHLGDARCLGPAFTAPAYMLVWHGPYPALVEAPASGRVRGELYEVSPARLAALDAFEDVPTLYHRRPVVLADGTRATAYVLPPARARGGVIPSGDWRLAQGPGFRS